MYANAIDAVELTKRAFLQTSRSWVKATEQALAFPGDQPAPWTLVDMGFDSADLYVSVQTRFAKSLLEATAEVVGVALVPAEPGAGRRQSRRPLGRRGPPSGPSRSPRPRRPQAKRKSRRHGVPQRARREGNDPGSAPERLLDVFPRERPDGRRMFVVGLGGMDHFRDDDVRVDLHDHVPCDRAGSESGCEHPHGPVDDPSATASWIAIGMLAPEALPTRSMLK